MKATWIQAMPNFRSACATLWGHAIIEPNRTDPWGPSIRISPGISKVFICSRAGPGAFDSELLTDLTAVYHGFGVFLANNPRKSTGELAYWPGTNLRQPEYVSEPMLGYAMAHIAWFRDEDRPAWSKALRPAPRAVFKQGLRYLRETTDSTFKPVRFRRTREPYQ
jgi:hypothetical protein